MKHPHHILWLCLTLLLVGVTVLPAAEPAPTTTKMNASGSAIRDELSPLVRETRQYVAQLTEQRNELREANDGLKGKQWLLIIYSVLVTGISGWLMVVILRRPALGQAKPTGETDIFGNSTGVHTSVTVRKNATITIRNSSTQKEEVSERVQTRAVFTRADSASNRQPSTRSVMRKVTRDPAPSPAPELAPLPEAKPPTTQRMERSVTTTVPKNPATVRIEQHSDRLDSVDVAVKPGTGSIRRELAPAPRHGLTIVEVMIALMVFSLILSAIASSWFSLRSLQKQTQDEAKVHELAQTLSERITGANWDWIGRDRPDELKEILVDVVPATTPPTKKSVSVTERYWRRCAWSWNRRELSRNTTAGTKIRLPPLTDHDWTDAELQIFRDDTTAPLTTSDINKFESPPPAGKILNPHNLIDLGIIDRKTGLPNLQVYVEYYHAAMLDKLFTFDETSTTKIRDYFKKVVAGQIDEELIFPESPFPSDLPEEQMNPADPKITLQAMVVRIIVTWGDKPKDHRHELVMARRK